MFVKIQVPQAPKLSNSNPSIPAKMRGHDQPKHLPLLVERPEAKPTMLRRRPHLLVMIDQHPESMFESSLWFVVYLDKDCLKTSA